MTVQDAALAIPKYDADKVLLSITFEFPFADAIGIFGSSYSNSLFSEDMRLLPIGIFSWDSQTWYDLSVYQSATISGVEPSVQVEVYTDSAGDVQFVINQIALVNGGSDWPLGLAFALLARVDTTIIPDGVNQFNDHIYSNAGSYMKIADEGFFDIDPDSASSTEIDHDLGYEPMVLVWKDTDDGRLELYTGANFGNSGSTADGVIIDEQKITIKTTAVSPPGTFNNYRFYYRIYYDT